MTSSVPANMPVMPPAPPWDNSPRQRFGQPLFSAGQQPHPGYHLVDFLGRGAFGEVWSAKDTSGAIVALKFMPCDGRIGPQEIRAMQQIRQLSHPGLVRVERIWTHARHLVAAMELAEGDLEHLLGAYQAEHGTAIPHDVACYYLLQAAEALDFLNTRQHSLDGRTVAFRHRDVKPSNLLICGNRCKLSDFGLARVTSTIQEQTDRVGTPLFAAPEVFQGRMSDRSDQYSLAMTYCLLRGGRLPFRDIPPSFTRVYVRPEPDLRMLPAAERPILLRALSRAPVDRWPSCRAFMEAVAAAVS